MSNTIINLMSSIKDNGLQSAMHYSFVIELGSDGVFDLSPYTLDVSLPGPKYDFYTNGYWRGNWEYKQPVGIKYDEPLIAKFMVPVVHSYSETENSGSIIDADNNLFRFLSYNRNMFDFFRSNSNLNFRWLGPSKGNISGFSISVFPVSAATGQLIGPPYYYINCFVDKILPFMFSAAPETPYQTMQISFAVGAEMNRL